MPPVLLIISYRCICFWITVSLFIVSIDLFLETEVHPAPYVLPSPMPLVTNTELKDKSERFYVGDVHGPESLAVFEDHIYTGTKDGKILDLHKGEVRILARLGHQPCECVETEHVCGRPLGVRVSDQGRSLYVVDAYLGLFHVDTFTGNATLLLDSSTPVGGCPSLFLNDLTVTKDGRTIYLTDSSTRWQRRNFLNVVFEHTPHGRVIQFDLSTGESSLLVSDMFHPNGIQLSEDEDYLLISESIDAKVMKYLLKGPARGTMETFVDNLPGLVDNIRSSSSGGYWLALNSIRDPQTFNIKDFISDKPWLRRFMTKVFSRSQLFSMMKHNYGMIIELEKTGNIVRILQDPLGEVVSSASEVSDQGEFLYLGSVMSSYIVKVTL